MNARSHQSVRLVAAAAVAAALAAPVSSGARGEGPIATRSPERPSAILRNDVAHFGSSRLMPATSPAPRGASAPIVVHVDGGFDWVSAGVGATGVLGLVVGIGVAVSALRGLRDANEARA
jgi:hypothetical protein